MSWFRLFQCCSCCCRRSNRIGHDVTIAPKGPQPMKPIEIPPILVLPDAPRTADDIKLELDDDFRL